MKRLVVLVAALAVGCGKSDKGTESKGGAPAAKAGKLAGGCDRRAKDYLCAEYYGMATKDWVQKECPNYGEGVTFVEKCPLEKAIARCVNDAGTPQEIQMVFYEPMNDEAKKAMCAGELRAP